MADDEILKRLDELASRFDRFEENILALASGASQTESPSDDVYLDR